MRGIDHQHVDIRRRSGPRRAGVAVLADAGGGGRAQAAELVLVGERVGLRLVHVLDGDQADAAIGVIDHQQLFDAVAVQQPARLVMADLAGRR